MYVFYRRAVNLKPSGCILLMGSLLLSSIKCNWTDLWRYSSDDYDHDHSDECYVDKYECRHDSISANEYNKEFVALFL